MSLDLQLNPPFVALIASESINPVPLNTLLDDTLAFGNMYQINVATINFGVGDNVLYKKVNRKTIQQLTQAYFIVDENDILFTENPLP